MTLFAAMVGFATGLVVGYVLGEAWAWHLVKRSHRRAQAKGGVAR